MKVRREIANLARVSRLALANFQDIKIDAKRYKDTKGGQITSKHLGSDHKQEA